MFPVIGHNIYILFKDKVQARNPANIPFNQPSVTIHDLLAKNVSVITLQENGFRSAVYHLAPKRISGAIPVWSAPRLTGQATVCIKHRRPLP